MAGVKKNSVDTTKKPVCQYGSKCYRKNPRHLQNYRHTGRDDEEQQTEEVSTPGNIKPGKKRQAATIETFFGKPTRSHAVSDSDSEESNTEQPSLKKKAKIDKESKLVTESLNTSIENEDQDVTNKEIADEDDTSKETSEQREENAENDDSFPASPEDVKENIRQKFLVDMPNDFYKFWEFCQSVKPGNPKYALEESLNLVLVGPFDILSGKHKQVRKNKQGRRPSFLLHYRYFYDPPEFQTVLASTDKKSNFHLGYYRDDPKENPVFVASNSPGNASPEKISPCGDNLFAAVHILAVKLLKSSSRKTKKSIEQLIKLLEEEAKKQNLSLSEVTKGMKDRKKRVVCPTFHGAGIVVPIDSNDVGYRPVPETLANLRSLLKKISEAKTESDQDKYMEDLQELITLVQFANDECDYGEGLELGLDLFSFGAKVFHPQIASLLPLAYQLLNRPEFSQIIMEHLKHRREVTECVDELAS